MKITRYRQRDFAQVIPLLREGTRGWGRAWREEILRAYRLQQGEAYLARENGRVLGTILLRREVRALVIYFLAVTERERGKHLGSSLVNFAEKLARREGRILRVDVAREFRQNVDFYLRLGFQRCGRVRNFYLYGDEQIFLCKRPKR